jgi:hypothetical protein
MGLTDEGTGPSLASNVDAVPLEDSFWLMFAPAEPLFDVLERLTLYEKSWIVTSSFRIMLRNLGSAIRHIIDIVPSQMIIPVTTEYAV